MITKTFIPKCQTADQFFRFRLKFDGDITKTYTTEVMYSNLPAPKVVGFETEGTQNYIVMEFEGRCNNTQMTVKFMTQTEAAQETKSKFFAWLASIPTWFDFIFVII